MDFKEVVFNTQLEKVREYWRNPDRSFDEYRNMLDLVVHQFEGDVLTIPTNISQKDGDVLIASYTQMAGALGIQVDEFHRDPNSNSSNAFITNKKSSQDQTNDRTYGVSFWLKRKDADADFIGMKNSLDESIEKGEIRALISDNNGELTAVSKKYLSGKRLFYRSIGYNVGEYKLELSSGIAVAEITK